MKRSLSTSEEIALAVRFFRHLPEFLRTPLTPEACRARVRQGLERREASFLDMLERAIFARPASPYRKLLDHAGATLGDVRELVRREGLEGRFDIAHCWVGWPSGVIGGCARGSPTSSRCVALMCPATNERLRWLDLVLRPFVRRIWRDAAHVSALSAGLRALAWQTEPGLAIDVIPNGVSTRQFTPTGHGERNDILFAGRLIRRKGRPSA
jgi:glycosyltransferase involved in cell wall biosynthesis